MVLKSPFALNNVHTLSNEREIEMIKKLVKYGNSQALILDKSILELLNIQEGSLLKLKTDGTSLIITPHPETERMSQVQKISPSIEPETLIKQIAVQQSFKDPKEFDRFETELKKLSAERGRLLAELEQNAQYINGRQLLNEKHKNEVSSPEYLRALEKLKNKHEPRLDKIQQRLSEIVAQAQAVSGHPNFAKESLEKMQDVFIQHQETMAKMVKLGENPNFIDERVALCEKHQNNAHSQELIDELLELQCKYVPEYRQMAAQLRQAGTVASA